MYLRQLRLILLGTASLCAWQTGAMAADLLSPTPVAQQDETLPAVSGVNGRWEFDPGYLSSPSGGLFRAAGSLDLPLGDHFGAQGDISVADTPTGLVYGGALHLFTRDPSKYLLGVTAGVIVSPTARLEAVGPEAELYLGNVSLEGWAGYAALQYPAAPGSNKSGFFGMGDVAYYLTPDFRLALGGSDVLGDLALHTAAEYMFHNLGMPLSVTADARFHSGGTWVATIGLKGYFGGSDPGKSLMDRQRQDDPPNRAYDLYGSAADEINANPTDTPSDPESFCFLNHGSVGWDEFGWLWNGETCVPDIDG